RACWRGRSRRWRKPDWLRSAGRSGRVWASGSRSPTAGRGRVQGSGVALQKISGFDVQPAAFAGGQFDHTDSAPVGAEAPGPQLVADMQDASCAVQIKHVYSEAHEAAMHRVAGANP